MMKKVLTLFPLFLILFSSFAQEYEVVITGRDQQLEKAVEVLLEELNANDN